MNVKDIENKRLTEELAAAQAHVRQMMDGTKYLQVRPERKDWQSVQFYNTVKPFRKRNSHCKAPNSVLQYK